MRPTISRGKKTSHMQKTLDQGKTVREEKPGKEMNTTSLKKCSSFIHKSATAGHRPDRPVITMFS